MGEREQFEAWVRSQDSSAPLHRRDVKGSERIGQYCTHWIQDQWEAWQASRRAALEEAIQIIETHRVPVGNSAAGEMAASMTMEALHEIRDAIRSLDNGGNRE